MGMIIHEYSRVLPYNITPVIWSYMFNSVGIFTSTNLWAHIHKLYGYIILRLKGNMEILIRNLVVNFRVTDKYTLRNGKICVIHRCR